MYKRILVNDLLVEGQRLLEALARNRFPVVAALWNYFPESMEWRLVIVSPVVDRDGPLRAYRRIGRVLATTNPSHLTVTDIAAVGPASQDFRNLQAIISSPGRFIAGPEVNRIQPNVVFEDAYVYQLPA
jgi:hypothetical protein